MQLKVLSWNIWFDGDVEKVNKFLESCDVDILCLQEVTKIGDELHISDQLTKNLGYQQAYSFAFQIPINGQIVDVGNVTFSKYPIINSAIHKLSDKDDRSIL